MMVVTGAEASVDVFELPHFKVDLRSPLESKKNLKEKALSSSAIQEYFGPGVPYPWISGAFEIQSESLKDKSCKLITARNLYVKSLGGIFFINIRQKDGKLAVALGLNFDADKGEIVSFGKYLSDCQAKGSLFLDGKRFKTDNFNSIFTLLVSMYGLFSPDLKEKTRPLISQMSERLQAKSSVTKS